MNRLISNFTIMFGLMMFMNTLLDLLPTSHIRDIISDSIIGICFILFIIGILWILFRKKSLERVTSDERTEAISNRSAMNALCATYLSFIGADIITETQGEINQVGIVFIFGISVFTYGISYLYLKYKKS